MAKKSQPTKDEWSRENVVKAKVTPLVASNEKTRTYFRRGRTNRRSEWEGDRMNAFEGSTCQKYRVAECQNEEIVHRELPNIKPVNGRATTSLAAVAVKSQAALFKEAAVESAVTRTEGEGVRVEETN